MCRFAFVNGGAARFLVLAFLKRKSDTFAAFKSYKAYAETCLGLKIKATRKRRAFSKFMTSSSQTYEDPGNWG